MKNKFISLYLSIFFSMRASAGATSNEPSASNISIIWVILAVVVLVAIYYYITARKCPSCKGRKYEMIDVQELDRFRGTKKVYDKKGKSTHTRHVQTTYVKRNYHFKCRACAHEWEEKITEEMS
jgi:rubredoxin